MYPYAHSKKPLNPVEFYAMLGLVRVDLHAYALKSSICNNSLGAVTIDDSRLYRIITKLHDAGLIEMAGEQPAGISGKPRMHYSISAEGLIRLKEELQRLQHAVSTAEHAGLLADETPLDIQRMLQSARTP